MMPVKFYCAYFVDWQTYITALSWITPRKCYWRRSRSRLTNVCIQIKNIYNFNACNLVAFCSRLNWYRLLLRHWHSMKFTIHSKNKPTFLFLSNGRRFNWRKHLGMFLLPLTKLQPSKNRLQFLPSRKK